jgi:hypothetical protein
MRRRGLLANTVIFCSLFGVGYGSAVGQVTTLKQRLVGTWAFVSSVDTNKDGTTTDRWGSNPKGLAIFDPDGHVSFMISRSDIPKFAVNNVNQGTAAENTAVVHGIIAWIGTWSVDEASKVLTTNIVASSFPNLVGKSQKRTISSLTADELKYTNPASSNGSVTDAVWKRAE